MDGVVQKICCICGLDVQQLRRTKDRRGNYYCKPCYTSRLEAYRQRLSELAAQSRAGTIVVTQRAVPSRLAVGENRFVSAESDDLPIEPQTVSAAGVSTLPQAEAQPEVERSAEQASDENDKSRLHLISVHPEPAGSAELEICDPHLHPPLVLATRVRKRPARRSQAGRKWSRCIVPIAACALLALCLDRSEHVRLAALLGLIGCGAAIAVTWGPGQRSGVSWGARLRELSLLLFMLGMICAGAIGAYQLGEWRAGTWGGIWMGGAVVLAGAIWLAWRTRAIAPVPPRPIAPATLLAAVEPVRELKEVNSDPPSPLPRRLGGIAEEAAIEAHCKAIVHVKRPLRRPRASARHVRISDLICPEAMAEAEAANLRPDQYRDPDVPISPVTNPPVTDLIDEFSQMFVAESARS